jgi:PucR C-terminal helix-turn-helix domain
LPGRADVQAAVDQLATGLGLSVLVEDRARQLPVWWNTQGEVDQVRRSTILDRQVDPSVAAVIRQFRLDRATAPVRTPAMPERGMWARWCVPVRHEGHLLGYLWVLDPDGIVTDADLPMLVECAELAGRVLAAHRRDTDEIRWRRKELLERLLERPDRDAARELTRLELLPPEVRIQVDASGRSGGWKLEEDLRAHVATEPSRPATSGTPLPLVDLGEAVRRARATLHAVAAGARPDPVSWDALGGWRLVVDAPATLAVADLHPGAEILARHTRADLLTTARIVLDHGGDVTSAAQALHVHRTTLYYRLDRIAELTGVDLRDGVARTDLQLALWLAAYRRAVAGSSQPQDPDATGRGR